MLWWHILFCIISIHKVIHLVQSQDEEEESTTVSLSTTVDAAEEQSGGRVSLIIPSRTFNNFVSNESEQNVSQVDLNGSSKQRIIIALAVLCAALTVILGFLVSIVVCQWLHHDVNEGDLSNATAKTRPDLVGSSYNYHDHAYRQAIKL